MQTFEGLASTGSALDPQSLHPDSLPHSAPAAGSEPALTGGAQPTRPVAIMSGRPLEDVQPQDSAGGEATWHLRSHDPTSRGRPPAGSLAGTQTDTPFCGPTTAAPTRGAPWTPAQLAPLPPRADAPSRGDFLPVPCSGTVPWPRRSPGPESSVCTHSDRARGGGWPRGVHHQPLAFHKIKDPQNPLTRGDSGRGYRASGQAPSLWLFPGFSGTGAGVPAGEGPAARGHHP